MDSASNDVLLACTIGDLTWLKRGLSSGIKPTTVNKEGLNALHLAAKYGQLDSIKYLLENCSIDVNCVASSTGNSALHYAIAHTNPTRSLQCTKLLLNRGGNHKWQNKSGETPLHVAAKYGHIKSVKLLLEKGADIQIKDKEGKTPYNTACVHNQHECARLLRALHWANKKDSDDREKLRKDEMERRQIKAMLVLQERLRKEVADASYNQWLEKKCKQANGHGPSPRDRKPMSYTRSTASSRGASKDATVSVHRSNPQLTSSIKVNPKQAKRNTASVGKPDKMQPYTNYPPKSSGSRTSVHFLGKSRSEPPRSGRISRSTLRSAASVPAGVKYYSRMRHRQSTAKRDNQQRLQVTEDTVQKQTVEDTVELESKEAHKSGFDMAESQDEQVHYELLEQQQELESKIDGGTDQTAEEINEEQLTATGDGSKDGNDGQNLEDESNNKNDDEEVEGSDLYPHEREEKEIPDELDFSKLKENDVFNEYIIEGDEDDLFHDVGQTNSLNALSLPNTLTKDRTPAEIVQLLRSFGGLSRSYRSNSFSHVHSTLAHRSRFQRRFSLGAIPEGQIVTNYNDEDQSSSQLLDEQFLESLTLSLSGDSESASKNIKGSSIQNDLEDGNNDQDSEPESDDETPSYFSTSGSSDRDSPADFDEGHKQIGEQTSTIPRVEISQDEPSLHIGRPQSLKVVNLAWDPISNTVHSCISESPLSPPDFSKMGGGHTPTRRITPPSNAQSHKAHSPRSSQASTCSQNSSRISIPSSPRYSPRDLSPSCSSSSVCSQPRSPRSLSPRDSEVAQPSAVEVIMNAKDLETRSLSSVHEESFHTLSMNSISSKSMVVMSANYDTFGSVDKTRDLEVDSECAKSSRESREHLRVRSAPNILLHSEYTEQRGSQAVLKTAVVKY